MRVIAKLRRRPDDLPLLQLFVHGALHYRQHREMLDTYRVELVKAARAAGIKVPIAEPVDLAVLFVDPCSPDLANLFLALSNAADAKARKKQALLLDDSLIAYVSSMGTFFPNAPNKGDRPFRRPHN